MLCQPASTVWRPQLCDALTYECITNNEHLAKQQEGKLKVMVQGWAYACNSALLVVLAANVIIFLLLYRGTNGWTDAPGCFHSPDSTARSADQAVCQLCAAEECNGKSRRA